METLKTEDTTAGRRSSNAIIFFKKSLSFKVVLCIIILFSTLIIPAQTNAGAKNIYRVTAYQKGDKQVTSVSNQVEIIPPAIYYIPNAFTPNGDGLNETFGLKGEGITDYELLIFNRWGNLIFKSNDLNNQWDGTYHNEMAPVDTYVYKITGKGPSGYGERKRLINENGAVTLVL